MSPLLVFTQQIKETPSTQLSSYYIDGTQLTQFSANLAQSSTPLLTCNGVLFLISKSKVFLYDPIRKSISAIPKPAHFGSTFSWALGHVRNAFKLLHFYTIEKFDNFHYCQLKEIMCEILTIPTSEIGSDSQENWRSLGKCPFAFLGRKDYASVDDKIYWLVGEKKFDPDCIRIMSFDLRSENFGLVCFPKKYSNRSVECLDLVEIKERLCLTDRLPWESTIYVWMMMRDKEEFANDLWIKKYRIELLGIDHHDVRILGYLSTNNTGDSQSEGEILIKFGAKSFGFYDPIHGRFRDLADKITTNPGADLQLLLDRKNLL